MPKELSDRSRGRPRVQTPRTIKRKHLVEAAIEAGLSPLEYMLQLIRAPEPTQMEGEADSAFIQRCAADVFLRLSAARYAAPYVHPRVATEIKLDTSKVSDAPIDVLELAKNVAFLLTAAEHGHPLGAAISNDPAISH